MQLENSFTVPVDIDTVYDAMNDPEMARCAEVCRRCAESCSAMAA